MDPRPEAEGSAGREAAGNDSPPVRAEERQAVIDALSEHFASDRLSMEDFEARLDRAHRAESERELEALVADLPATGNPGAAQGTGVPARRSGRVPAPPADEVAERGTDVSIWGGRARGGSWTPPRRHRAVAIQGGIELDYREARLGAGAYDLRVTVVMGSVEVVVPPDLRVETEGSAVLGSFEHEGSDAAGSPGEEKPLLRVGGFALMGSVEISVAEPGTSLEEGGSR